MPSSKKQKLNRESNAAYITSQPLFDALRNATNAISNHKVLLQEARDTIQSIHVKLPINDGDAEKHEACLKNIVAAWAGETQTYHEVFRQITLLTGADISQGRPAAKSHEKYMAILDTISRAQEAVDAFRSLSEEVEEESDEQAGEESEEEIVKQEPHSDSASDSPPSAKSSKSAIPPTVLPKRPFVKDESAEEGANKVQKLNVTATKTAAHASHEKKQANSNARSRRKAVKKAAADAAAAELVQSKSTLNTAASTSTASKIDEAHAPAAPVVEYEDVNSEVEARVKAKAEKTAAKKARREEKKRKRESVDSFAKHEPDEGVIYDDTTNPEPEQPVAKPELVGKPNKKKVKKAHVSVEDVVDGTPAKTDTAPLKQKAKIIAPAVNPAEKVVKRKPDAAADERARAKKRKTNHAGNN
ncbi:uncharacterized protein RCC_04679 [Ramularia collo-cygni]|uniref:Uncharacterized protein n=1 Tax=Ramularia collo-cygni TaxID=112498 RepID=A0A2D3V8C9_9PEZI|nr:uncharacterized protein RCC_04679 [Ramularia collo-cygni]CZT18834.1 uncharacterized protein RCC_04679 [Ramularia collo-cygni]